MSEWSRACAWCGGHLPARMRADARFCSQVCRQQHHRHPSSAHASTLEPGPVALSCPPSVAGAGEPSVASAAVEAVAPARSSPVAEDVGAAVAEDVGAAVAEDQVTAVAEDVGAAVAARRRAPVAALYIDPRGPYPDLLGWPMCWPAERDARTYDGPWPVVAHPTCAPWSVSRALSSGAERDCAPRAVEQVRRWGGVLEHPAGSLLWAHARLPRPGDPPDAWGGISVAVEQARWGHAAIKPTWLYIVRSWLPPIPAGAVDAAGRPGVFDLGAGEARRSPPAFARWLCAAATGDGGYLA